MPGLWHGVPSTSACLEDKGARWAGSTWAWFWQGRGWQEQAPSGHKTQAQLGCPPTCTRWAQTSLWLDGWSCECGRGRRSGREEGKGGLLGPCNPHARPEVRPRTLDPRFWSPVPFLAPGTDFSLGTRGQEALSSWGRVGQGRKGQGEKPTAAYMGASGGRQTEGPSSQRKVYGGVSFKVT